MGGEDTVAVVPEDVRALGQYLSQTAQTLDTALDSAAKDVEGLLNGSWTGTAATEFAHGWNDVHDGGNHIMTALTGMAEKLGVTIDQYETTDNTTRSRMPGSSLNI